MPAQINIMVFQFCVIGLCRTPFNAAQNEKGNENRCGMGWKKIDETHEKSNGVADDDGFAVCMQLNGLIRKCRSTWIKHSQTS